MTEAQEQPVEQPQYIPWEAPQYEAALAQLERIQEQIDELRSTIPSLVAPLVRPGTSKTQIFAELKKSAIESNDNIKALQEQWNSEQTKSLLSTAKESMEKDGDLTKAKDVAKYGWCEQ